MVSKFVVDVNVGRLSKWLRVIGYDALFLPDANDADLLQVAQEQGRTVVTKDRYILERRVVRRGQVKAVLIQSDDFREQMRELTQTLGVSHQNGFSRGIFKKCVNSQAVYLLSEQHGLEAQERR